MLSISLDFREESVQQILNSVFVNNSLKFEFLFFAGILAPLLSILMIICHGFEFGIDLLESGQNPSRVHHFLAH
jgi:hypothetical protein